MPTLSLGVPMIRLGLTLLAVLLPLSTYAQHVSVHRAETIAVANSHQTLSASDAGDCRARFLNGASLSQDTRTARAGYDSLKAMLSDCRNSTYACAPFGAMEGAIANLDDNELWYNHRLYLEQVYPWNTTDCYRCAVLGSIARTFTEYIAADAQGNRHVDYNGYVAVLDYILSNRICTTVGNDTSIWQRREAARARQHEIWADTVKDSLKTPLDTSAVSLQSIGLGFLLGLAEEGQPISHAIKTFYAVENPFEGEAELRYSLASTEPVQVEIFDVLGNRVWSSSRMTAGSDERDLRVAVPAGLKYAYARLSTGTGEVRTIRLVRK